MTTSDARSRLEALAAWHAWRISGGTPASDLPRERDLSQIAQSNPGTVDSLRHLPLNPPGRQLVGRWEREIFHLLRGGELEDLGASAEYVEAAFTDNRAQGNGGESASAIRPTAGTAEPNESTAQSATIDTNFVAFDPTSRHDSTSTRSVRCGQLSDDSLRLYWTHPKEEGHSIYRVVARDDFPPYSPDDADPVATTTDLEAIDARPLTSAVRHVQVWLYQGRDAKAARRTQPVLLAQETIVSPVTRCEVRESHRQVTGSWRCQKGILRVEVYRVPLYDVAGFGLDSSYEICQGEDLRQGFVDDTAPGGQSYQYRIYAVASAEGAEAYSPVTVRQVYVPAPVLPVTDLTVVPEPDRDDLVSVEWAAPSAGEVWVYRTDRAPTSGAGNSEMSVSALEQTGLLDAARLVHPVQAAEGRCRLSRVPLGVAGGHTYITPVTVVGDVARIGTTVTRTRVSSIADVQLVQRVDWQLLTFAWPFGATYVQVFVTAHNQPLRVPPAQPVTEISRSDYEAQGGLRLQDVLPSRGCTLHVAGMVRYAGACYWGPATVLPYHGMLRIRYRLLGDGRRLAMGLRQRQRSRTLEVMADGNVRRPVPFVVVHNAVRLPLTSDDGEVIARVSSPLAAGEWMTLKQFDVERKHRGWLRVFVQLAVEADIAVLDPPVATLTR